MVDVYKRSDGEGEGNDEQDSRNGDDDDDKEVPGSAARDAASTSTSGIPEVRSQSDLTTAVASSATSSSSSSQQGVIPKVSSAPSVLPPQLPAGLTPDPDGLITITAGKRSGKV